MTDGDVRKASNAGREPSGAVDPQDTTLSVLRREARRQGRTGRWVAASLVGVAVGFMVLLAVAAPAQFQQAFGLADHHQAVVESIGLSSDQPNKGSVRKSGAAWDVHVRWDDGGTIRHNSGIARSQGQPYQVGQEVQIATAGNDHQVSFRSTGDAVGVMAVMIGVVGLSIAAAAYYWHGSRAWRASPDRVCASAPTRIQVDGAPVPHRRRQSRVNVLERGQLVNYRTAEASADASSFLLLDADHGRLVGADDQLDLWSVSNTPGPPFAVRRVSDGLWWLGSASN